MEFSKETCVGDRRVKCYVFLIRTSKYKQTHKCVGVADISIFCCLHYTLIAAKIFADNQRPYQNVRKNSIGTLKKKRQKVALGTVK